jgi:hypothetical protein
MFKGRGNLEGLVLAVSAPSYKGTKNSQISPEIYACISLYKTVQNGQGSSENE